jgi:hypothetical protein
MRFWVEPVSTKGFMTEMSRVTARVMVPPRFGSAAAACAVWAMSEEINRTRMQMLQERIMDSSSLLAHNILVVLSDEQAVTSMVATGLP